MLLIGASLLVKSFWKLMDVNPGFDPAHVQTFRLRLPDFKYDNPDIAIRAVKELRRRIGELPGVIRVGITSGIPLGRIGRGKLLARGSTGAGERIAMAGCAFVLH